MENTNNVVLVLILLTLATFNSAIGNTEVRCKASERQALLRFKQDLKDPMNRLSNWVADGDCCSWTGVACDNLTGHVGELHLGNPHNYDENDEAETLVYFKCMLGGKINPSLLNLNYLNYMNLSSNDFDGIPIPSFIGFLTSLIHLDLSNAGFGGLIPHQLGNLSSIRYLNLEGSYYLKIEKLQWISSLTLLQYLDMSGVNMSKAYDWVQVLNNLPSLAVLRLSDCGLGNISPHLPIINFTALSIFDVSRNGLSGLFPNWLFSLKNLHFLCLSGNVFGGSFQLGLTNMTNRLKILDLSCSQLNSTIPQWLGGFNRLEFLDLSHNVLHGNIPESFGNLTSMVFLVLSSNQLEGEIPMSFGNLSRLRGLDLSGNKLSGKLTNQLGKSRNLISIFLHGNLLSGPITTAIGKLSKLQDFDVSHNQLSGSLPMDIGKLPKLRDFDVSHNQLNGSLPMDIGKLSNLQYFDASNNQFNGSLPESFGQLVKLQYLDISNNSLKGMVHEVHFANVSRLKVLIASGNSLNLETSPNWVPPFQLEILKLNSWHLGPKLPLWLRGQQHLSWLEISNTGITDTIPIWLCNFSSQLSELNLSHNQFHGPFSSHNTHPLSTIDISSNQFSGSLPLVSSKLSFLDFSNNSFSGSVTHFFCDSNSSSVSYLFLGNNLLSGAIPNCWKKWEVSLTILNLENNNLVGVIPSSMGNLRLFSLVLRNNSLSGELPLSLRNYASLSILDLGGNKLIGKIPEWIGMSFSRLLVLNLRSNNFEGDIPLQLCNLIGLQVFDMAHNNLSGTIPRCFYNLSAMTIELNNRFFDNLMKMEAEVVTKGRKVEYGTLLRYVRSIDLSGNNLDGEIPVELTKLHLQTLNLSNNHLVGKIPSKIGDMRWLESLDLSQNKLSGKIPSSISDLNFLSYLNLSYNNLTGSIPTGTQLQSFNESSFIGNQLCGPPLQHNCSATDPSIPPGVQQDHLVIENYMYLSLGLGFAFGFWAVLGSLLFNVPWRIAFSRVVDRIVLKLYAFIIEIF